MTSISPIHTQPVGRYANHDPKGKGINASDWKVVDHLERFQEEDGFHQFPLFMNFVKKFYEWPLVWLSGFANFWPTSPGSEGLYNDPPPSLHSELNSYYRLDVTIKSLNRFQSAKIFCCWKDASTINKMDLFPSIYRCSPLYQHFLLDLVINLWKPRINYWSKPWLVNSWHPFTN